MKTEKVSAVYLGVLSAAGQNKSPASDTSSNQKNSKYRPRYWPWQYSGRPLDKDRIYVTKCLIRFWVVVRSEVCTCGRSKSIKGSIVALMCTLLKRKSINGTAYRLVDLTDIYERRPQDCKCRICISQYFGCIKEIPFVL